MRVVGTKRPGFDVLNEQDRGMYAKIASYQNDWGVKDEANDYPLAVERWSEAVFQFKTYYNSLLPSNEVDLHAPGS